MVDFGEMLCILKELYLHRAYSLGPRPLRGVRRSLRGLRRYEKGPGIHCSRMHQE